MIIGIDGNEANVEKKVGISEYAFELLQQFKEIQNSISANSETKFRVQVYVKDKPRPDMPTEDSSWKYIVLGPKKLWTQIGLPIYLFTHFPRPDVFFSPTHYAPRFSPVPTAISIMDVSYLHFPELFAKKDLFQLTQWTKYSAAKAKRIFTISNASRNDILKEYKKAPDEVIVTYPGIKPELAHSTDSGQNNMTKELSKSDLEKQFGISGSYILFVGTLQPRKNVERLIEAFSKIKGKGEKEKNVELVIVGKKGWLYESILAAPEKFGVTKSVKFLEFVDNSDLPSLYKHAEMFVLPSLYEGFGLPVVEAMKYGAPVITSNVSSLPEAGGDAAFYVNPENVEELSQAMQKLLDNPKLRAEMIKKGYQHIKEFSWEESAKKTLDVLTGLIKNER